MGEQDLNPMLHVEKMTTADFPFAVELANTMDWSMTEEDFRLSLKLEPEGCFVLFDKLNRVGISTSVSFEKVGWFGNLVIDQGCRSRGGGTMLVQRAVDHLRNRGVKTIGLYAYQHLIRFYENLGFTANREFAVFQGKTKKQRIKSIPQRITEKEIPEVLELDKQCFCGDRKRLLALIILDEKNQCYFSKSNGKTTGYVATKEHEGLTEIGPLVCRRGSSSVPKTLLEGVLGTPDREVFACLPTENKVLAKVLIERGLQESFRLTRMFLGPAVAENCTYVAESLERG